MSAILNTIIIYAKDMNRTAAFYKEHFGFKTSGEIIERLIELTSEASGATLLIHQAARGVKLGQASVKLVFSVKNVEAFKTASAERGLVFGSTHEANGYQFSNVKYPDKIRYLYPVVNIEKVHNKTVHIALILPHFNRHRGLTDEVSNAKIQAAKKGLAVLCRSHQLTFD